MARWHERLAALLCACVLLFAAGAPAGAQGYDGRPRQVHHRFLFRHRRRHRRGGDQRQPAGGATDRGAAGRTAAVQRRRQARLSSATGPAPSLDAATGKAAAGAPANLKPVRVNNRLRRSIEAALGGLTLLSPDPGKRFEAAQAVFKSKDPAAAPRARHGHRQGNGCTREAGPAGGARRRHPAHGRCQGARQDRGHRRHPRPRRPGLARTAGRPARQPDAKACSGSLPRPSPPWTTGWRPGTWRRTSGTGCRSARCCCWRPSALPSPSA